MKRFHRILFFTSFIHYFRFLRRFSSVLFDLNRLFGAFGSFISFFSLCHHTHTFFFFCQRYANAKYVIWYSHSIHYALTCIENIKKKRNSPTVMMTYIYKQMNNLQLKKKQMSTNWFLILFPKLNFVGFAEKHWLRKSKKNKNTTSSNGLYLDQISDLFSFSMMLTWWSEAWPQLFFFLFWENAIAKINEKIRLHVQICNSIHIKTQIFKINSIRMPKWQCELETLIVFFFFFFD